MKNALLFEKGLLVVAQPFFRFALNDRYRSTGKRICRGNLNQTLTAMKLLLLLITGACITVYGNGFSQPIHLSLHNAPLEKVFAAIEEQSHYHFIYTQEELQRGRPVSIDIKNASITDVLDLCLKEQPLSYSMREPYIIIKLKEESPLLKAVINPATIISGTITNGNGEAIAGATVRIKGSNIATVSNEQGEWRLSFDGNYTTIQISHVSYTGEEVLIKGRSIINVTLQPAIGSLDETVIMAYGKTTKRLNTGNIGKVSAEDISKQPVSNPLAALQGRIPGLVITQSSGMTGAAFKVQIRGQNSLLQGSDPLFIIDGVPFATGNNSINDISNSTGSDGLSPFNLINPADIESIEILKDADATAIYGSRGANGVILITTKTGIAGKSKVSATVYTGLSKVTRGMPMMNTQQYLQMRREAFTNDGISPTITNAPDLFSWDTTRYTDFIKLLTDETASNTDAQASISGGNEQTRFLLGSGYTRETNVFPGQLTDKRGSVHLNLDHSSANKRFSLRLTTNYIINENNLVVQDPSQHRKLAPDIHLYTSSGMLNWQEGGTPFRNLSLVNPLAYLYKKYEGQFDNILTNLLLNYKIMKQLNFKISFGYNKVSTDETSINPSTSLDPAANTLPFSNFNNSGKKSWIIEPQAEYYEKLGKGKLSFLMGATWQENTNKAIYIQAKDYTNDLLLYNIAAAASVTTTNNYTQYHYTAFYGRLNYNIQEKYILNLSGRRDGSSRFGPDKRFNNFGAVGAAWIFSNESWMKKSGFLSFGKCRISYGITGNDQIGDYKFLDTYTNTNPTTYQGMPGLRPSQLFNPDFTWEENKKLELAADIGFFKDKILLSASYFRNRSGNQLVSYSLPIQTGFSSVVKNIGALIENNGFEFSFTSKIIAHRLFSWSNSFNLSIPHNKLISFPGLASSSYANTYITGQSLSVKKTYQYLGVDPSTGIYQFTDADRNGLYNTNDKIVLVNTDPLFYGGFQNTIIYKGFKLDIFLEFKKQTGKNYLYTQGFDVPGYGTINQPVIVLNRWQKPGDISTIQKYTANFGTPAYTAANDYLLNSNAVYSDASFIRGKNIYLSYTIPASYSKKFHIENSTFFIKAQNLFTITNYTGADPENQSIYKLSPLRTITGGFQLTF